MQSQGRGPWANALQAACHCHSPHCIRCSPCFTVASGSSSNMRCVCACSPHQLCSRSSLLAEALHCIQEHSPGGVNTQRGTQMLSGLSWTTLRASSCAVQHMCMLSGPALRSHLMQRMRLATRLTGMWPFGAPTVQQQAQGRVLAGRQGVC